jgi:hypothetical protein
MMGTCFTKMKSCFEGTGKEEKKDSDKKEGKISGRF